MIAGINNRKYRQEVFTFKTPIGYVKKPIVILAGENERARLLEKAASFAKSKGWKF